MKAVNQDITCQSVHYIEFACYLLIENTDVNEILVFSYNKLDNFLEIVHLVINLWKVSVILANVLFCVGIED